MSNKCYVTNKSNANPFSFGGFKTKWPGVILYLTDDVFAHFTIRARRDAEHVKIMKDIGEFVEAHDADSIVAEKRGLTDVEFLIDYDMGEFELTRQLLNLYEAKARSGLRILREMKAEFERDGKLTS